MPTTLLVNDPRNRAAGANLNLTATAGQKPIYVVKAQPDPYNQGPRAETLNQIGARYGATLAQMIAANPQLRVPGQLIPMLTIGQTIYLPEGTRTDGTTAPAPTSNATPSTPVVDTTTPSRPTPITPPTPQSTTTPSSGNSGRARLEELLRQLRERRLAEAAANGQPTPPTTTPPTTTPPTTTPPTTTPPSIDAATRGPHAITDEGVALIKSFEGLRLTSYKDSAGVWTIGYGTTRGIVPGMTITQAQAEQYLREDISRFEASVNNAVKVPLTKNQFSALVSFTYNLGSGALSESTLLRLLNTSDYAGAAGQFGRWVYADGQRLEGLVRRRNAERAMFLGEDWRRF